MLYEVESIREQAGSGEYVALFQVQSLKTGIVSTWILRSDAEAERDRLNNEKKSRK